MKFRIVVFSVFLFSSSNLFSDNNFVLRPNDAKGCYVTNGESVAPIISFIVAIYDSPAIKNRTKLLGVIDKALEKGCLIDEADSEGMSPLNASILFNSPELVKYFLLKGSDPFIEINKPGSKFDGFDSHEFLNFLISNDTTKDRKKIKNIFDSINNRPE